MDVDRTPTKVYQLPRPSGPLSWLWEAVRTHYSLPPAEFTENTKIHRVSLPSCWSIVPTVDDIRFMRIVDDEKNIVGFSFVDETRGETVLNEHVLTKLMQL